MFLQGIFHGAGLRLASEVLFDRCYQLSTFFDNIGMTGKGIFDTSLLLLIGIADYAKIRSLLTRLIHCIQPVNLKLIIRGEKNDKI